MKPYLKFIPECYYACSILLYWILSGKAFNAFALAMLLALLILLVFRSKTIGILASLLFIFISLFLFASLMSQYRRFHEPTPEAHDRFLYGSAYIGLNVLMALVMLVKYALMETGSSERQRRTTS